MIVYFDTSALIPLIVRESGSLLARRLWDGAEEIVVTRLVHVEASAALAQANRLGRISAAQLAAALEQLSVVWRQCSIRELDESLMLQASSTARRFGLREYDSVHCAAAAEFAGVDAVAASGDQLLLSAWRQLGVITADTAGPDTHPT